MRFRWHRSELKESLGTTVEILDSTGLTKIIRDQFPSGEIVVTHYGYDNRCDWDCWIVTVDGATVGFADGPVEAQ